MIIPREDVILLQYAQRIRFHILVGLPVIQLIYPRLVYQRLNIGREYLYIFLMLN